MKKTFLVCAWLLLSLQPAAGTAEVRIGVSSAGRKMIFNEAPAQRARRLSARFVPVPSADISLAIDRHADAQQIDPRLVRAVIQVESGYNHRARSNKGAMGLMQLMPGTASQLRVQNPYDPDENVRGGTQYLRKMIDRFGRLDLAVAAYNAGPGAVEKYKGIPPYRETKDYVRRVLSLYQGGEPTLSITPVVAPTVAPAVASFRPAAGPAKTAAAAAAPIPGLRKPYITRNAQNRIVLTTALDPKP